MVTDMINSGITEPQINIKKYVMIPPLLVWVGHCRSWVLMCCCSSCGKGQNLSSEGWDSWSNLDRKKNPLDDHAVESILRHSSACSPWSQWDHLHEWEASGLCSGLITSQHLSGQPARSSSSYFQLDREFCISRAALSAAKLWTP